MSVPVKPIPEGARSVTPHLVVKGVSEAIAFYEKAFGAKEKFRMVVPGGQEIGHAELIIGDSPVYLAGEFPDWGSLGPQSLGGSPVTIHLFVEDVDAVFARAVEAGATATMPPDNAFWGDRYGKLTDPFGHHWSIATHIEDVPPDELPKRMEESMAKGAGC
jgi:PhnB protein